MTTGMRFMDVVEVDVVGFVVSPVVVVLVWERMKEVVFGSVVFVVVVVGSLVEVDVVDVEVEEVEVVDSVVDCVVDVSVVGVGAVIVVVEVFASVGLVCAGSVAVFGVVTGSLTTVVSSAADEPDAIMKIRNKSSMIEGRRAFLSPGCRDFMVVVVSAVTLWPLDVVDDRRSSRR